MEGTTAVKEQDSVLEEHLAARTYLYKFFQKVLGLEPSTELMGFVGCDMTDEAYEICTGATPVILMPEREMTLKAFATMHDEADIEALRADFNALFVGPDTPAAPPWESMYVSKAQVLKDETTLAVRQSYVANGYLPAKYPNVVDDHISLELDFLYRLSEKMQRCENQETRSQLITESKAFLARHLMRWLSQFHERIAATGSWFYAEMTRLLLEFVKDDRAFLTSYTDEGAKRSDS